jgi:hypothetical protein
MSPARAPLPVKDPPQACSCMAAGYGAQSNPCACIHTPAVAPQQCRGPAGCRRWTAGWGCSAPTQQDNTQMSVNGTAHAVCCGPPCCPATAQCTRRPGTCTLPMPAGVTPICPSPAHVVRHHECLDGVQGAGRRGVVLLTINGNQLQHTSSSTQQAECHAAGCQCPAAWLTHR